jgi:hypothetical protein
MDLGAETRRRASRFAVQLLCALACAASVQAQAGETGSELDQLTAENARLKAENARLRSEKQTVEVEVEELREHTDQLADDAAVPPPLSTTVDEPSGTTTVTAAASKLRVTTGSRAKHWIAFRSARTGTAPGDPDIRLHLSTKFSGGIYRGVNTLRLSVDGESFECPVISYKARPVSLGSTKKRIRRDDEFLIIALPPPAVARMEAARRVTGRLGRVELTLSAAQLTALRAVVRAQPAG